MSQASTSDGVQETLSAAMDGEAMADELHGALDAASRDAELRAKWERMHFASAVMRGALITSGSPSASVPLGTKRRRRVAGPSRRPRLGPAVAAVVAVLAALTVVLVADLMQEEGSPNLVAATAPAPTASMPAAAESTDVQPLLQEVVELGPIDRRRMNAYMLQHARYNAAAGTAGIPLARVLGDPPTAESEEE